MLFVEFRFFIFFAVVYGLYWSLESNTARKWLLLIASCVFYAAWDWRFLGLLLLPTAIDYAAAIAIERSDDAKVRLRWLQLSLFSNLGILFFFKYFNFFADSAAALLTAIGAPVNYTTLNIVLPVGISFYIFQTLSYTLDVYWRRIPASHNWLNFALFVTFFPQLVAGPIVRARDFLYQLEAPRRFADVPVRACLALFAIGFFKKACISDNFAPHIDPVFETPELYTAEAVIAAVCLYAVQIYCDFSGYTDMAIATAGLLGYRLVRNFAWPYFSVSITEFWRRWHISLSSWLKDYLYIPLGGNRGSKWFTYRNLMLTMLLGGLWHGAAWTFVAWGALHGAALVAHREWQGIKQRFGLHLRGGMVLGWLLTLYWIGLTWIFFRAQNWADAWQMAQVWLGSGSSGTQTLALDPWPWLLGLLALHALTRWRDPIRYAEHWPAPAFAAAYGATFAVLLSLTATGYRPFIYFQF